MTASGFRNSRTATIILSLTACLIVGFIVTHPDHILESSLTGLTVWWKIVFPAMLPFLVIVEMMAALGVLHGIGVAIDPVMRRLFRLPGSAGWCLAAGWTAGAPVSARHIAELRREGELTCLQAERLMALAHAGSPILIVIVVAAGFLAQPETGLVLLIIHWLGAIAAAYTAGLGGDEERSGKFSSYKPSATQGLLTASLIAMADARAADGRSFGRLLGDSVYESIQRLLLIGGYMIFFSVLLEILMLSGLGGIFVQAIDGMLSAVGISSQPGGALLRGLFEQHLGAYAINNSMLDVWSLAAVSAILGWSGLCLHAQVKAATSGTDIRYYPFFLSRLIHAATGAALSLILFPILGLRLSNSPSPDDAASDGRSHGDTVTAATAWQDEALHALPSFSDMLHYAAHLAGFVTALFLLAILLSAIIDKISRLRSKSR